MGIQKKVNMTETELEKAEVRAEIGEIKTLEMEEELRVVANNLKSLEVSEAKSNAREKAAERGGQAGRGLDPRAGQVEGDDGGGGEHLRRTLRILKVRKNTRASKFTGYSCIISFDCYNFYIIKHGTAITL